MKPVRERRCKRFRLPAALAGNIDEELFEVRERDRGGGAFLLSEPEGRAKGCILEDEGWHQRAVGTIGRLVRVNEQAVAFKPSSEVLIGAGDGVSSAKPDTEKDDRSAQGVECFMERRW